ncbi:hypothetical protein HYT56_01710 [Candidatus Woesearchaeota archaeon]|nr:hypothetical protein [Candidatus Woesearchaeota archaeon]
MKKLLLFFIFLLLIQQVLSHDLKQGEEILFESRQIKVIALQQEKAIIQVDEEKNIINKGQSKIIDGVIIKVTDILYTGDESSLVTFNTELSYSCGDLTCSPFENSKNCCKDCPCQGNKRCTSSGCIVPECFLDDDCNDSNELTKDSCQDYKCKHQKISCTKDSQCNDNDPETDDFCSSGTCQNLPPICKSDEDCKDEDLCTLDQCINKDCSYKKIENCSQPEEKNNEEEKSNKKDEEIIQLTEKEENFFKRILSWIKNILS